MTEPLFLNPQQAADLLGVKISTIYTWVQMRQIPYRKHGRLIRFERRSLLVWSKSREIQPYADVL